MKLLLQTVMHLFLFAFISGNSYADLKAPDATNDKQGAPAKADNKIPATSAEGKTSAHSTAKKSPVTPTSKPVPTSTADRKIPASASKQTVSATPTVKKDPATPASKPAPASTADRKIPVSASKQTVSATPTVKKDPATPASKPVPASTADRKIPAPVTRKTTSSTLTDKKSPVISPGKKTSATKVSKKIPVTKVDKKIPVAIAEQKDPIAFAIQKDPVAKVEPKVYLANTGMPSDITRNVSLNLSEADQESGISHESGISTVIAKAKLIKLAQPVSRVAVGDPRVADIVVLSPSQLYMLGKSAGSTNVIFWYADGTSETLDLYVVLDAGPLIKVLRKELPNEKDLRVSGASGAIVLSGSVSDTVVANTVLNLAESHARTINKSLMTALSPTAGPSAMQTMAPERALIQVVNLMQIRDSQQVMLEVKIAEIRKDLLDKLGIGVLASGGGDIRWNIISSATPGTFGFASLFDRAGLDGITLNAEKMDSLVKILAEPTIVAMSGQEGSFLAGGMVLVPVVQSAGLAGNTVTLKEIEFGVGLKFVPTVLSGGRINLQVAPEVSEVAKNPLVFNTGSGGNAVYPSFVKRRVNTTVQLQEGQSLIIGGLMGNNLAEQVKAFPLLGELPIIGTLFRSSEMKSERTELVVVVSPSLAKATQSSPGLPTDNFIQPSRSEFLLENKLEGSPIQSGPANSNPANVNNPK